MTTTTFTQGEPPQALRNGVTEMMTLDQLDKREADFQELMISIDEGRRADVAMPSDWGAHVPFSAFSQPNKKAIKQAAIIAFINKHGDPREYCMHRATFTDFYPE